MNKEQLLEIFFKTPSLINISSNKDLQVKKGVFTPILMNMKSLLSYPDRRRVIIKLMSQEIDKKYSAIVGIAYGGDYFAAALADEVDTPVAFLRKENKAYGILLNDLFVGKIDKANEQILLIDDVVATGNEAKKAIVNITKLLKERNQEIDYSKISLLSIFSYCDEVEISKKVGIKISALIYAKDIIEYGLEHGYIDEKTAQMITDQISFNKGFEI